MNVGVVQRRRSTLPNTDGEPAFIGRDGEIRAIEEALRATNVVIVHGATRVGKSRLAIEYARAHAQEYPGGVFFVQFDNATPARSLIRLLHQFEQPEYHGESVEDQCHRAIGLLGAEGRVLILYDAVPDEPTLRRWEPLAGLAWHLVVTSTVNEWSSNRKTLLIDALADPEVRTLVTQRRLGFQSPNPYRGLAAFRQEDAHVFFGREQVIEKLRQRFCSLYETPGERRLLAVIGPSGSGKSSVALAGLLPALEARPMPDVASLRIVVFKPGAHPVQSLARALLPLLPSDSTDLLASRQMAIENLLRSKEAPSEGLCRFAADLPNISTLPLVVVVDQFEEIYTLCKKATEQNTFVGSLLYAVSDSSRHVSVVLTLRNDFLSEVSRQHQDLSHTIAAQHEMVLAMSRDEMHRAIAEPARHAGRPLDGTLVELLLTQASNSEGALPLLQFALKSIWEGLATGKEPVATLKDIGGVGGALAQEAQRLYDRLSPQQQRIAQRAFVRMVQIGEGTRVTRRRATLNELCGQGETGAQVRDVLLPFADERARLVAFSAHCQDSAIVTAELTHEALVEHWTAMRQWIAQSRDDERVHNRAAEAARLWREAGRTSGRLSRPPDLEQLRAYRKRSPADINEDIVEYIKKSEIAYSFSRWIPRLQFFIIISTVIGSLIYYIIVSKRIAQRELANNQALSRELLNTQRSESSEKGARASNMALQQPGSIDALALAVKAVMPWFQRGLPVPAAAAAALVSVTTIRGYPVFPPPHLVHSNVTCSALSPDGSLIATASRDGEFIIWHLNKFNLNNGLGLGKNFLQKNNPKTHVKVISFSPDNSMLVSGNSDGSIRLWNTKTDESIAIFLGHAKEITMVGFFPGGDRLYSASEDGTVRIWAIPAARPIYKFGSKDEFIVGTDFSSTGKYLATLNNNGSVNVRETNHGSVVTTFSDPLHPVKTIHFFEQDSDIVSISKDGVVAVWDGLTGHKTREIRARASSSFLSVSPIENRLAVISENGNIQIIKRDPGGAPLNLNTQADAATFANFSPSGKYLVTSGPRYEISVWNTRQGSRVATFRGHAARIVDARFSADGKMLISTSEDGTVRLWWFDTDSWGTELAGGTESPWAATFSSNGKFVVAASLDGPARMWDRQSRQLISGPCSHAGAVSVATIAHDSSLVATAGTDNVARIWNVIDNQCQSILEGHKAPIRAISFSADDKLIVTASENGIIRVGDVQHGVTKLAVNEHAEAVVSANFSPDSRRIITTSKRANIAKIYNILENTEANLEGHSFPLTKAIFSPDGKLAVTASWDAMAIIWNIDTGKGFPLRSHSKAILDTQFSLDSKRLLMASWDATATLWDVQSRKLLLTLKEHNESVSKATFSPDGTTIATASDDATVRLWDAQTGECKAVFRNYAGPVTALSYSPDGTQLITVSEDGKIWILATELRRYLVQACRILKWHSQDVSIHKDCLAYDN